MRPAEPPKPEAVLHQQYAASLMRSPVDVCGSRTGSRLADVLSATSTIGSR